MITDRAHIRPTTRAMILLIGEVVVLAVIIAAIVLLPAAVVGEDMAAPRRSEAVSEPETEPDPEPDSTDSEDQEDEVDGQPPASVDPDARDVLASHRIERGDTLWDLAEEYWNSRHLWPDLYTVNADRLEDPDDLTVGATLEIPEPLMRDGQLGEDAQEYLLDSYIQAYNAYRRSAELLDSDIRDNARPDLLSSGTLKLARAQWLLYSGTRFDQDYMDERSGDIHASDRELVERYLERFGTPEMSNGGL